MEIEKIQSEGTVILTLNGRLDTTTSPKLQEALTDALSGNGNIELDLMKVDYVSSAGLRVLLQGEKASKAAGKTMNLKNVTVEVMEVFDVTGFTGVLNII